MHGDDWFTLAELTERLGGVIWVEEQLGTLLESWAAIEPVAPVVVHFSTAGGHHRWHAQMIRECLPTSPKLLEGDPVQAPTSGWQSAISTLAELTAPDATVPRLKALAKVVDPWLEREIGALRELHRPVSDAAMTRWLRFVSLDHHDDNNATDVLLASQASTAVSVRDHRIIAGLDLRDG